MNLRFRISDLLAVALVLVLAVVVGLCFLPEQTDTACQAEIYQNGGLLRTVSLEEDQEFSVSGRYVNTVTVKDGAISITSSSCPGEDCVHSGAIDSPGRSIVCLPNGLEIRIVQGQSDVDFVVG